MLPVKFKRKLFGLDKLFDLDSFDLFDNMSEEFDKFFGSTCCQIDNVEGTAIYQMEVPGFNKDNLKVEVAEGVLTISGKREVKDKDYVGNSQISKRLTVGDVEDAEAEVKDGILTLKLKYPKPAPPPEVETKEIEIKG